MIEPVQRASLSEGVFRQLRDKIVRGELASGPLPSERELAAALKVSRPAVREAMRRLQQARLVDVRHGGATRVLDFRSSAGLGLLADLLLRADGSLDTRVARSIIEMRSALAPDIARRAAEHARPESMRALDALTGRMIASAGDLAALQSLALEFWGALVDTSDNIAYRLAFNTLRDSYLQFAPLMIHVLADELSDLRAYRALAAAVRARKPAVAERHARRIVTAGERAILNVLEQLETQS